MKPPTSSNKKRHEVPRQGWLLRASVIVIFLGVLNSLYNADNFTRSDRGTLQAAVNNSLREDSYNFAAGSLAVIGLLISLVVVWRIAKDTLRDYVLLFMSIVLAFASAFAFFVQSA